MARSDRTASEDWTTSGGISRLTGIPQQTLISWDRAGVLKATARPGSRSSQRAPRRYDEDALVAALFAKRAVSMGFKGEQLKQMVRLMQTGSKRNLDRAALFTYRTGPGLMTHVFSAKSEDPQDARWIAWLRDRDALAGEPTSLWKIREHLRPIAQGLMARGENALAGSIHGMEER